MKKVFIGVLAALMLFAFTACEPQTIAWPTDKDVSYLEIVQVKDFIEGEIPTKDGFNVIIHYTDGEPETVPGAVTITAPEGDETDYTVTSQFDFNTETKTVPVIGVDTVKFEKVTSVSITGASNVTVVDQTLLSAIHDISAAVKAKVLSFAGDPVFTLNYENGSKSFTLADEAAGKFDYILNVYEGTSTEEMATTDKFEKGNTYTVKVASYELADGEMYKVENSTVDFTITVVDAVQPDTSITGLEVRYSVTGSRVVEGVVTEDQPILAAGTYDQLKAVKLFAGDTVTYTVKAVRANEATISLSEGTIDTANTYQVTSASKDFTVDDTNGNDVKTAEQKAAISYYDVETGKVWTENIIIPAGSTTNVASSEPSNGLSVEQNSETVAADTTISESTIEKYLDVTGLEVVGGEAEAEPVYDIVLPNGSFKVPQEDVSVVIVYDCYGTTIRKGFNVDFTVISGE